MILDLEAGANDYVTKPFHLPVLLARIRTLLRQYALSEDAQFTIGPFTFRPTTKLLVHREIEQTITLSEKEAALLKRLCQAHGKSVPMDEWQPVPALNYVAPRRRPWP